MNFSTGLPDAYPDRASTSLHEASHAVIGELEGDGFSHVTAEAKYDEHGNVKSFGHVRPDEIDLNGPLAADDLDARLVWTLAGPLANALASSDEFVPLRGLVHFGGGEDLEIAKATAAVLEQVLGGNPDDGTAVYKRMVNARNSAEGLLRQEDVWAAVCRIAHALYIKGAVTPVEVKTAVKGIR